MDAPIREADTANPFAAARRNFRAAQDWTYLNVGSRGIVSAAARQAAVDAVDGHFLVDRPKEQFQPLLDACRAGFATIVGGLPDEVAVAENTSGGLNAIATAIDWKQGDNVVLSADLEHANNVYLWHVLKGRGVEVRTVPPTGTEIDANALAAAIDRRTRVVTAASVTFTPGFRTDLAVIGKAARAADALFLVDGVQSCGVLELDAGASLVDAVATSTSKGLLGLMGLGFLWVRSDWIGRLTPTRVARTAIATSGHYSEMEGTDFTFAPTATRFEVGSPNWVGIAAAAQAMAEINAIGVPSIERHALALAEALRGELQALGLPVQRPREARSLSHLVTVGERNAGNAYSTSDATLNRLAAALQDARVRFSIRRGLIRFGLHLYNDASDVAKVVDVARGVLR